MSSTDIAVAAGRVWVSVQAGQPGAEFARAGGTVKVTAQNSIDSIVPASGCGMPLASDTLTAEPTTEYREPKIESRCAPAGHHSINPGPHCHFAIPRCRCML